MTAAGPLLVETDIDVHAIARDHQPYPRSQHLPAVLRWDATDPWAVELHFTDLRRSWVFGWELLVEAAGLAGRAGSLHGDVRIRRATPQQFEIHVPSPDGTAVIRVDAFDLVAFVQAVRPRQAAAVDALQLPDTAHALLTLIDGRTP